MVPRENIPHKADQARAAGVWRPHVIAHIIVLFGAFRLLGRLHAPGFSSFPAFFKLNSRRARGVTSGSSIFP